MNIKTILLMLPAFLMIPGSAFSQSKSDTVTLVNEFFRVMSFSVQPTLYYTTTIRMSATPVFQEEDTLSMKGIFYKDKRKLYYSNGKDEMFFKDTLLVQINKERKSIWIKKAYPSFKDKLNVLPVSSKQFEEMLQKNFTIKKTTISPDIKQLELVTSQIQSGDQTTKTLIQLEYNESNYFPRRITIDLTMQRPADEALLAELRSRNIPESVLVTTADGKKYLKRKQSVEILFNSIRSSAESGIEIPTWSDKISYNEITKQYEGKGNYKNYEVTKTF